MIATVIIWGIVLGYLGYVALGAYRPTDDDDDEGYPDPRSTDARSQDERVNPRPLAKRDSAESGRQHHSRE